MERLYLFSGSLCLTDKVACGYWTTLDYSLAHLAIYLVIFPRISSASREGRGVAYAISILDSDLLHTDWSLPLVGEIGKSALYFSTSSEFSSVSFAFFPNVVSWTLKKIEYIKSKHNRMKHWFFSLDEKKYWLLFEYDREEWTVETSTFANLFVSQLT